MQCVIGCKKKFRSGTVSAASLVGALRRPSQLRPPALQLSPRGGTGDRNNASNEETDKEQERHGSHVKVWPRTKQALIHSGFGPTTTARQVLEGLDLTGRVAIVTGGYSGIGLETTRSLTEAGAVVIVPARTPDKARQALSNISRVEQGKLDLLDPASIDAFASGFLASGRPLHILINNAGIMATPLAWQAYGQSKTANVLFAVELDRRGEASGIRAFAVHPGAVVTELSRHMTDDELRAYGLSRTDGFGSTPAGKSVSEGGDFKTLEQGAATSVWCATSPQLAGMGGVYCQDVDVAEILQPDSKSNVGVRSYAIDPEAAQRLWSLSERFTGVKFDPTRPRH